MRDRNGTMLRKNDVVRVVSSAMPHYTRGQTIVVREPEALYVNAGYPITADAGNGRKWIFREEEIELPVVASVVRRREHERSKRHRAATG